MQHSVEIAAQIVASALDNVAQKVQEKRILQLSKRVTAQDFLRVEKQFVGFISTNPVRDGIPSDSCPNPLPKDSLSKLSVSISQLRSPNSFNQSTRRSNIHKSSISKTRSRNESITKQSVINRDKLQHFVKLEEQKQQQHNQMEYKLRKYYLNSLSTHEREEAEIEKKERQENEKFLKEKNKLEKGDRSITYDYNGKIMSYSPNNKLENILTLLRSRVGRKQIFKPIQKKKLETQTIDLELYESINIRNRKHSTIIKENREKERSTATESIRNTEVSPMFHPSSTSAHKTILDLKLSQFRNQSKKYKSIHNTSLTSRLTEFKSFRVAHTMPNRDRTRASVKTEGMPNPPSLTKRSGLRQNLVESSSDIIYLNPELYYSMIN